MQVFCERSERPGVLGRAVPAPSDVKRARRARAGAEVCSNYIKYSAVFQGLCWSEERALAFPLGHVSHGI